MQFGKQLFLLPCVLLSAGTLLGCQSDTTTQTPPQSSASVTVKTVANGVEVYPRSGAARLVSVRVYGDGIFRVTSLPHTDLGAVPQSLQVVAPPDGKFTVTESADKVTISTEAGRIDIQKDNGAVSLFNAAGEALLNGENSGEFATVTRDPVTPDADSYAVTQQWNKGSREAYFGLGQHQNSRVNFAGESTELTTNNLEISIPMVVSEKHYGVLWDNAAETRFGDPRGRQPLAESLTLYDDKGEKGALTASYYDGDKLLVTRREIEPDYQFLANNTERETPFPEEIGEVSKPRVVWSGAIESDTSGEHAFSLYNSGYASVKMNGEVVQDRWRMNWNPWFHDFSYPMTAGEKVPIEIEWDSENGYLAMKHTPPQPEAEQYSLQFSSDTGKAVDYYVMIGDDYDDVIAGYRTLTGKAVLLPKWAYGFWQSRERYKNQQELIDVVKEYRKREIPLDNIVLDWSYWPENAWGSHDFDKTHFPDPKAMVQELHNLNTQIMISVWPKFYSTTDNYKELAEKGYMLTKNVDIEKNRDWIGEGYLNGFYDPYTEESQQIFWRQIAEKLNSLGFDAWWLDASEPDIHSNLSFTKRKEIMTPLAIGSGAEYFNSYALPNAEGVYKGERETDPDKRSFILTRSGFGGIQRTGAAIWSGDTVPRWSNLRDQIGAGLGASLAGMPNWTMDIGGFTPENKYRYTEAGTVGHFSELNKEDQKPWQELNLRWFQFGAFVPLFRSHGQNPYREIYNLADENTPVYDSMVYYTRLRYRLLPYIYSEAGKQYHSDNTLMRGLVMDFPEDSKAINLNDAYLFGPAFLVNPIYQEGATTREVYLPQGTDWYNFYSGEKLNGGQTITADAPLIRMPLFVKAGSIVPTGPAIQTVYEKPDAPWMITVYAGKNGEYTLYEDDGKTYNYEQGAFSEIPLTYDTAANTLTFGARKGEFDGMTKTRTFFIRVIDGVQEDADSFAPNGSLKVAYDGNAKTVQLSDAEQ